nr:hypothetical protein [Nitrospirota bacterium]
MTPRDLTYDEKKAAEAAFRGFPYDPTWSATARAVYDGILGAAGGRFQAAEPLPTDKETTAQPTPTGQEVEGTDLPATLDVPHTQDRQEPDDKPFDVGQPSLRSREEAIQAGLLIDVTPLAKSLGLPLPVGITKPLWRVAITASDGIPEEQHEARLRDVLMALRLRLVTNRMTIPWIEFPALLSFPPEPTAQVCVLHAVAHGSHADPLTLTLALREEIATIITPLSN